MDNVLNQRRRCREKRKTACTNALQGIPTDQLGEVKKAWLSEKLEDYMCEIDGAPHISNSGMKVRVCDDWISVSSDLKIKTAKYMRKNNINFGELNALLDSAKE